MNSLIVFACLVVIGVVSAANDGKVKCHTCMGRDSENCATGEAVCRGVCYKVLDSAHDLIAKGCTTDPGLPLGTEVASWEPKPYVELYWTKTEEGRRDHIRGRGYFCDKDFCNAATMLSGRSSVVLALISFLVGAFLLRL